MLRKSIVFILSVVVILSFAGCGFKKNIEGKLAEKITEGVLDKVAGDGTKVDLEEDKITFKGDDGSEFSIGDSQWPKGKAIDLIPEFENGKIVAVMNSDSGCVINFENVQRKDFETYFETIKGEGYTENSMDMTTEETISYYASSTKNKSTIGMEYSIERKEMMLTVGISE